MKKKLVASLILNAFILWGVNVYYVMINVPPDGRWKFQILITSLFVSIYLVLFFIISKKLLTNPKNYYFITAFNAILSVIFLIFAKEVEVKFQYTEQLYLGYIATAPYIIIFTLGIILYIPIIYLIHPRTMRAGK